MLGPNPGKGLSRGNAGDGESVSQLCHSPVLFSALGVLVLLLSLCPSATTGVAHACPVPLYWSHRPLSTRPGAPLESMSTGSQHFGCCERGILDLFSEPQFGWNECGDGEVSPWERQVRPVSPPER